MTTWTTPSVFMVGVTKRGQSYRKRIEHRLWGGVVEMRQGLFIRILLGVPLF